MTEPTPPQQQPYGAIAVFQALVAQLIEMLWGPGWRREMKPSPVAYEGQLVHALFGGGLARDPDYIAASPRSGACRRSYARELGAVRAARIRLQAARTSYGHGYRRNPATMCFIHFERRIAQRRTRRLGPARLAFVVATHEPLSDAPP